MNKKYHTGSISDKRFLVTGGAGFIGSHIVDYLMAHGAGLVRVADNLSTGCYENICHHQGQKNFEFHKMDLVDPQACMTLCKDIDVVFHQAALGSVPRSIEQPLATNANNVTTQLNILWACVQNKICRLVYASSSSVYGDDSTFPKVEERTGMPLSPYAVSKKVNELYAGVFASLYDLKIVGLRYFNVFGPRQNPEGPYAAVIPLFIKALLEQKSPVIFGDGLQSRDFTYVENIVQGNIKAAFSENPEIFGTIMNIGAGGNTSINQLYQMIADATGTTLQPRFLPSRKGDVLRSSASVEKAQKLLGYEPSVLIKEGIRLTTESFKK
jgi:UDP-N-acetylglucosamine/UDP-N-acetylgalactosamine 4-epimerase